jgi:ubiquinone/menaquinone biosynthesis C-methylase UbiE
LEGQTNDIRIACKASCCFHPMNHSIIRSNYNRMSTFYDIFASSEKLFSEMGLKMLSIQPGENILEIGFGTGHTLLALVKMVGETGKVYGLDLSDRMAKIAERRIIHAGMESRTGLLIGDATNLPLVNDFFDAIFISFTLELFSTPEILIVLGEFKRVLRKNGRLVVIALEKNNCRAVKVYEWFVAQMPLILDCRPINVQKMIERTNFEISNITDKSMWGLPVKMILAKKYG